jgi:hypothetical protein
MYRIGHGDCFLLTFRGGTAQKPEPIHMLIDCGRMPGSGFEDVSLDDVVDDIAASTGEHLHVVVCTHEHLDHVGGFGTTRNNKHIFDRFSIDNLWVAWTEDPNDELANELRDEHGDVLLNLLGLSDRLAKSHDFRARATHGRMLDLLELELAPDHIAGERDDEKRSNAFAAARKKIKGITNKRAIQFLADKASRKNVHYLYPHGSTYTVPGVDGVRVYALGPPRRRDLLYSEDPIGDEGYHPFGLAAQTRFLLDHAAEAGRRSANPFAPRYRLSPDAATEHSFFKKTYGLGDGEPDYDRAWQDIQDDWLGAADALTLRLNRGINNTSLVLAFELVDSGKVLLFTGDAQRGNWISWPTGTWHVGDTEITARELLSRCVFYKVGHHGSHNATLKGQPEDDYPNLEWLGTGRYLDEFTAMIPANSEWARGKRHPWNHPLPAIARALRQRTERLFDSTHPLDATNPSWQSHRVQVPTTDDQTKLGWNT